MCGFLNLNANQGVITAKSFQNTINNWSGMVNLHIPKKCFFFWRKVYMSEYKTTLNAHTGLLAVSFYLLVGAALSLIFKQFTFCGNLADQHGSVMV